jgi:DAACS family dicarboxylate/amino acid:cation (Na+ or H+) symporter
MRRFPSNLSAIMSKTSSRKIPFFFWIIVGLLAGLMVGYLGKVKGIDLSGLKVFSGMVLQGLQLLATPLIFAAVVLSLVRAQISGRSGLKLGWLLITNTLMAIVIGLLVVNVMKPGEGAQLGQPSTEDHHKMETKKEFHVVDDLIKKLIPKSIGAPFVENDILAIVILALATGFALRAVRKHLEHQAGAAIFEQLLDTVFQIVLKLLHALFFFVPFAVFAVVAAVVGKEGFDAFATFAKFVVAVLLALGLQGLFYLTRLSLGSWVRPGHFLKGSVEALTVAFSTASSTATLPVTYRCASEKLGLREENARLGTMVGGNLNNDGTALYEAMAALFIAQALGMHLELGQQLLIVFMAVIASVGAAGIPEAGLVTMMAVFSAVKLPVDYIPLLLTVDWFLDRCRTAMNVMGDLTVSSLLDGKTRGTTEEPVVS